MDSQLGSTRFSEKSHQKAEAFLYDMVAAGDPKYKKSQQAAISSQAKAKELLLDELPDDEWEHDQIINGYRQKQLAGIRSLLYRI